VRYRAAYGAGFILIDVLAVILGNNGQLIVAALLLVGLGLALYGSDIR
jgi:hypothetical protein